MRVIDSHTAGEPTRVIIDGGPDLGAGPLRDRVRRFRRTADQCRRVAISEPRGHAALVGALLCEPEDSSCATGVIFFNNTGYLGMCGHGAIGVAVTLAHMGRIGRGVHRLETPVGVVEIELIDSNQAVLENVASFRQHANVTLDVETLGRITGDIAWGGNWFFLTEEAPVPLTVDNIPLLNNAARSIRARLRHEQMTGTAGAEIDHIEFCGPPESSDADSRNFVLCPGGAWDDLHVAPGRVPGWHVLPPRAGFDPGERWVQESVIGTRFTAEFRHGSAGQIIPRITGHAYVCAETVLIQQSRDPFRHGMLMPTAD